MKILLFLAFAGVAAAQCGSNGTFVYNPFTDKLDCTGKTGAAGYVATFTGVTGLSVTAATHGQGTKPVGFCYDNATPANLIAESSGFPTVAANGDMVFAWSGSKTGYCLITALGNQVGPAGAAGAAGPAGPAPSGTGMVVVNSGTASAATMSSDCTFNAATGAITCTKTNGTAFVASATTDTTNAANISSGSLPVPRMNLFLAAANTWTAGNDFSGATWKVPTCSGGVSSATNMLCSAGSSMHYWTGSDNTIGTGGTGLNQLTGDITAGPGTGSQVATLATVNSGPGACGDATHVCVVTTNAKGLVTSQTATAITAGTGNAAAGHSVAAVAGSVTFAASSASAGTVEAFIVNGALSANTTSTLSGETPYSIVTFTVTQAASTTAFTFSQPSGFSPACPADLTFGSVTVGTYVVNAAGNGGTQLTCESSASGLQFNPVTLATVSATCVTGNLGRLVDISDSTTSLWGAIIVGSGSNDVTGRCNGTSYTVMGGGPALGSASLVNTVISAHIAGTSGGGVFQAATAADISAINYVAGGGSANAQTATYSPAVAALTDGLYLCWLPTAANSTTTPTFAPNGLTAHTITKVGGALVANDLTTTAAACAIYGLASTTWELQNPQTTASGVSSFSGDGTLINNSGSSGGVTVTLATAAAHKFWGNNTGSTAAPGYQSIGVNDLPTLHGSCTEVWGGSGTSFALTSGDDAISINSCYNDTGGTRTITALKCTSDNGSNTTTVNPTFGASGTGTTILSGALTCGNSNAMSSTGTISNASWTTGTGIAPAMSGTLTGTHIVMIVEFTYAPI